MSRGEKQPEPEEEPRHARTENGGFYLKGGWDDHFTGLPVKPVLLRKKPRFVPAHIAQGSRVRKGKVETSWNEPDSAYADYICAPFRGGKVDTIRILEGVDAAVELFGLELTEDDLMKRLTELRARRQQILCDSWYLARPLKKSDLVKDEPSKDGA